MMTEKLGHTHFEVLRLSFFNDSYLRNDWQEPFGTWNIIISYHDLSFQNTVSQGQAQGWGLGFEN